VVSKATAAGARSSKSGGDNPGHGKRGHAEGNPGHGNAGDNPGHGTHEGHGSEARDAVLEKIRAVMWKNVGILRDGKELKAAIEKLEGLAGEVQVGHDSTDRIAHELANIQIVGELIARSALAREESRGSHYRADFPCKNDEDFQKHSMVEAREKVSFR
jgi:succinate dehydrogenase/fumarate reductase flavoprotein subunit